MPRGIYSNLECDEQSHGDFHPLKHQLDTAAYFLKSKYKGLLLYHELGSGKTCTAIMIADQMLKTKKVKHVYVLSPGSLRKGWIGEYCDTCGAKPKYMKKKYTFITYNYMVGKNLPDFNGSLVIIDEVHNLINGAKNMSFHAAAIYNAINSSKCKVLALSGTPIYNYVYEWALLGNLLKPGKFPEIRGKVLDTSAFTNLFDEKEDGTMVPKNKSLMKNDLQGIVSYFPGAGKEFVPLIDHQPPIKVQMSIEQELGYWKQVVQEEKLSNPPNEKLKYEDRELYELLKQLYVMAKKKILSRSAANFFYPPESYINGGKNIDVPEVEVVESEVANEENGKKRKKFIKRNLPDVRKIDGGWIDRDTFKDKKLYEYSRKFVALYINIILHDKQKHVIFTFFKTRAGVTLIKTMFDSCGIPCAVFTGDMTDTQRKNLLEVFNSEENRYGDIIRVLLVTEAGAEGISLLETRHMHILESSPRVNRIRQAIGRVARFMSHVKLPKSEQNVKIWRYWSTADPKPVTVKTIVYENDGTENETIHKFTDKTTIDEKLYEDGLHVERRIDSFLKMLQDSSVTSYKKLK